MKILTETPDYLVFESRPIFWACLAVVAAVGLTAVAFDCWNTGETGSALIVLACIPVFVLPMVWVTFERVQVVFDATAGTCTLRRRTLRGDSVEIHPLSGVARALVQTNKGDGESGDTHRAALVIGADRLENRHGLTRFYISGKAAPEAVRRMNDWLDRHRD